LISPKSMCLRSVKKKVPHIEAIAAVILKMEKFSIKTSITSLCQEFTAKGQNP